MLEKLQEIIAEQLGIEAAEVKAESNFKDDLNADSLDLFEMIMAMEEEFGVEIPSDDLDQIATEFTRVINGIYHKRIEYPPQASAPQQLQGGKETP